MQKMSSRRSKDRTKEQLETQSVFQEWPAEISGLNRTAKVLGDADFAGWTTTRKATVGESCHVECPVLEGVVNNGGNFGPVQWIIRTSNAH